MSKYWILTAALVLAACAKTEMDAPILKENPGEKVWNVQIDATKAAGPDTKAQAAEDGWEGEESTKALDNSVESRIDFYWGGTDYIRAYKEVDNGGKTDYVLVGTLTPKNVAGNNATLHGQITGTFSVNEMLYLVFPKYPADENAMYVGQKGTVADIAKNFDYALGAVKVAEINGDRLTLEPVSGGSCVEFTSLQSITRFEFSYASVYSEGIVKLTITAPYLEYDVTVIPEAPGTVFYVAIPDSGPDNKQVYTFMAETESGKIYEATKKANLEDGKYYKALISGMSEYEPVKTPLTIEARESGTITILNPLNRIIMYNADGQGFTHMTTKYTNANPIEISVTAGQKVILGGENETYATSSDIYTNIITSSDCYVYGNVMSLVNWQYYVSELDSRVRTAKDWAFTHLFGGWNASEHARPHLYNHPVKTIELPATSVGKGAYRLMFAYCTNLTEAPELPATTFTGTPYSGNMNDQPYGFMFTSCTSLRKAPSILPATTIPDYTYMGMFQYCYSLEASPVLPAQSPGYMAYNHMFIGCRSLKQITCYAKNNIGNDGSTRNWVEYVPSTGIFIKDPDASWPIGKHGIPTGWNYDNPDPLTIEAIEDGTLTISNPQGLSITWGKSITLASATTSSLSTINIPMTAGDKIRLWGDNACYGGAGGKSYLNTTIGSTAAHYVYGDIRSLLTSGDFTSTNSIGAWAFNGLFKGDTGLRSHPDLELTMGASSVGEYAFTELFSGCTGLVRAPSLPATILAEECYSGMFSSCTSLVNAPSLPATNLSPGCYQAMFSGCTALVSAPALPATTLAEGCYMNMFDYCTSLKNAPVLNAATLVQGCYNYMFRDCSSLASVKCLATNPALSNYEVEPNIEGNVDDWLKDTAASGTFTKKNGVTWPSGSIPAGWSTVNQ